MELSRKRYLKYLMAAPVAGSVLPSAAQAASPASQKRNSYIKLSCNLYSFNGPLRDKTMTLEEVIDFCSDMGFSAIDLTGYYLPNYPQLPPDETVYHIKNVAFRKGLAISGTGVRNNFTTPDRDKRNADIALVKNWIHVAAKLDAPVIRIFTGSKRNDSERPEAMKQLLDSIRECVEYGRQYGVIITLQNHNQFLLTARDVLDVLHQIDSEWFGLNLDIGSLRKSDPYEEVKLLAPYANTWQFKENVYRNNEAEKVDVQKMIDIITGSGYRGYLPVETLGPGDPQEKLQRFVPEIKRALGTNLA